MRKGVKIYMVNIGADGTVSAIDSSLENIKLNRARRNLLVCYKDANYIESIKKEFNNPDILHNEFTVIKNDEVVFSMND